MKVVRIVLLAGCAVLGGFAAVALSLNGGGTGVCEADCRDQPCAQPPCCNGDANGDGLVNIADPVFLLQYLFQDGLEPTPMTSCSGGGGALPATGQTTCFDENGDEVACNGSTCAGQNGLYQPGCPPAGRFIDNPDGTVTDTCTGLMWQKWETGEGNSKVAWCEALAYCENLTLGGNGDWRLPTVRELQSLVDYGRHDAAVDPVFNAESGWYWSSTSHAATTENAWVVGFLHGHVSDVSKLDFRGDVLAVRTAQ